MTEAVAGVLAEMEVSPQGTDILDIVWVLEKTGHEERPDDSGLRVFVHPEWGTVWTLDGSKRGVPIGYVMLIARTLRARIEAKGRRR